MLNNMCVSLDLVKGTDREYIIKDKNAITLGRIVIVELDKKNKNCIFRLKFYNMGENSYDYLVDTLELMLSILFKNMLLKKANVLIDEEVSTEAFTDVGFELEGLLINNKHETKEVKSELIFGITGEDYEEGFVKIPITLEGRRIDLKLLTPENSQEMLEYCIRNKDHLSAFEPKRTDDYYTLKYQRNSLIESYKEFLNGKDVNFGIFENGELIGKIRISNIVMGVFKSATMGYSIDKDKQGKGYMKEAVNMAVEYIFEEVGIHRIEGATLVDNIKSQKVLQGCNFKMLGINEKYLYINGEWRDHITFYKVRED